MLCYREEKNKMQPHNPLLLLLRRKQKRGRGKCLDLLLFFSDKSSHFLFFQWKKKKLFILGQKPEI